MHLENAELYEWMISGRVENTRLVLRWMREARAVIILKIMRKSFKNCGITSALDDGEDHMFDGMNSDDDQFEGFSHKDVEMAEQLLEVPNEPAVLSGDDDPTDADRQSDSTNCDSLISQSHS